MQGHSRQMSHSRGSDETWSTGGRMSNHSNVLASENHININTMKRKKKIWKMSPRTEGVHRATEERAESNYE